MVNQSFFDRLAGKTQKKPPVETESSPAAPHQKPEKTFLDTEQCTLDVYQTDDTIVIKALVAGVHPEDLDISITNDVLTIRGVRADGDVVRPEDYYYQECYFGPFSRSVILPENSGEDSIKAKLKNGVLTIRIPKAKKVQVAINTH